LLEQYKHTLVTAACLQNLLRMCENDVRTAQAAKLIAKQPANHTPSSVDNIGLPAACDQALQGICQLYAIARPRKSWQAEAGTQFPDLLLQNTQW